MRKFIVSMLFLLLVLPVAAQVANNAISLERNGRLSLGTIPECGDTVTLQWWMNPQHWIPGAEIITWGENFAVKLASPSELKVQVNGETFSFKSNSLMPGNWFHMTLQLSGNSMKMWANNADEQETTLAAAFTAEKWEPLIMGGGFLGCIDEVRLWSDTLPAEYNRFWNNTIDSYNPLWKKLAGYWKFDQTRLAGNVYDYSGNGHHGTFSANGAKRTVVTDNRKFAYRRNLAYSDCSRFFDRGIQQGQYLKSNVISMIGGTAQADGSIKYKQPDNAGTVTHGSYLAQYKGRTGLLDLDGEGAEMNVGKESLIAYNNNVYLGTTIDYTFMTWVCLDNWTPGAFLIRKESTEKNGISLRLGNEAGVFVLRCNGAEFTYNTDVTTGNWHHIGFSTGEATLGNEFVFVVDGATVAALYSHTAVAATALNGLASTDCIIGAGIDGKLDQTTTWSQKFNAADITAQSNQQLEPGIGKSITGAYSRSVDGLWKYDIPDELGRDSYSTPEWFRMIKSAFDGYEGAHVTISLDKYADEFFIKINNNAQYRETLANSIAAIGNEPFLDGVDYDFEWNNNWSGIGTLCQLVRARLHEGKIQAVSPHELYYNFPTDKMQYVDYFNFQDYGPANRNIFNFDNYKSFFTKAKNHGYPIEKIMLSYATTTSGAMYSNGSRPANTHPEFYPTGWRSMPYETFTYNQNSCDVGEGLTRYFTGMEQVWLRSEYMNNNGCAGIFYWDMGNDTHDCNDPRSLATFASFAINSNVQKIVEKVDNAAAAPQEYEVQESSSTGYRIRSVADGHTTHFLYQNGDELFAGEKAAEARSIFILEETGEGENSYYIKANDGRYIQDRNALATTNDIYRFGKEPVSYSIKGSEYSYPDGHICLEQTYYTPGKAGFTDVQRCLKCNGNNAGVSTWGPWTAASHWTIEPVYGYTIYGVSLDGVETINCLIENYSGTRRIYDGGFIAVPEGESVAPGDFGTSDGTDVTVTVDDARKRIIVTESETSSVEIITDGQAAESEIFDITGRKLKDAAAQGIYIINGKKFIKR